MSRSLVVMANARAVPLPDNSVDAIVPATDLAVGTAAEHLVCADLLLAGYRAFRADQHCPYDVAVETGGRLVRVQVKSTRQTRRIPQRAEHQPGYVFYVRRAGKRGQRLYGSEEFDLLALVALDVRRIAYLPASDTVATVIFRAHDDGGPRGPNGGGKTGRVFSDYPVARALQAIGVSDG